MASGAASDSKGDSPYLDRCIESQQVYSNGMFGVLAGDDVSANCHATCWPGVMLEP